jgi:hypothetical protein
MSELRKTVILAVVGIGGALAILLIDRIARHVSADARLPVMGYAIVLGAAVLFLLRRQRTRHSADSTLMDPDATFRIVGPHPERREYLFLSLGVSIGCVLIVVGGGIAGFDGTVALVGAMVFGATIPAFLLTRPRTRALVFSPAGLDYSDFGIGPVAWREIRSIRYPIGPSAWLVLRLEDEASYWSRASKAVRLTADRARVLCGSGFAIRPEDLGVGFTLLATALDVRLHRFGDLQKLQIDGLDDRDSDDEEDEEWSSPSDRDTSSSSQVQ